MLRCRSPFHPREGLVHALRLLLTGIAFVEIGCTVDAEVGTLPKAPLETSKDEDTDDEDAGASASRPPPTSADGGELCGATFTQEGEWIDLAVIDEVRPTGVGGEIRPGTYVLTALRSYLGGPRGTGQFRETMVLVGSPSVGTWTRLSEARLTSGNVESHPPRGDYVTWEARSSALFDTQECPVAMRSTGSYSASDGTFEVPDGQLVRVYTRIR